MPLWVISSATPAFFVWKSSIRICFLLESADSALIISSERIKRYGTVVVLYYRFYSAIKLCNNVMFVPR